MKRRELVRHLARFGCALADEGAKHSKCINLADPRRITTVSRHSEIAETLALSTNQKFLRVIEKSRDRAKREGTISAAELRRRLGLEK